MQVELPHQWRLSVSIKTVNIHSWLTTMIAAFQAEGGWAYCSGLNFISSPTGKSAVNHALGFSTCVPLVRRFHRIGRQLAPLS